MALPDFICIGAQKAGTSWLHEMLGQHPDVWLPPLKELHFFDRKKAAPKSRQVVKTLVAKARRKYLAASEGIDAAEIAAYQRYLDAMEADDMLTLEWYNRIFDLPAAASKKKGEMTPAYLDLNQKKFAYLEEVLPRTTKFIAILREPLARALSQIRMSVEAKKADPQTEADWQFFIDHLTQISRGDYKNSVPRWNAFAPKGGILYMPFSDVRERPNDVLRAVEDFIGVPHFDGYAAVDEVVHVTKKITIPEWVVKKVESDILSQRKFLIDEFGSEFYEKTK